MNIFKTYLWQYCIFLIALILLVSLFNLAVDPYGMFNYLSVTGFNDRKTRQFSDKSNWIRATIQIIREDKYDTLFLGSSRVGRGLNPDHLLPFYKAYNAAYSGANFVDFLQFKEAIEDSHIKTIVWGIDYGTARFPVKFTSYPNNISNKITLENLLAGTTLCDSVLTAFDNFFGRHPAVEVLPNGLLVTNAPTCDYQQSLAFEKYRWNNQKSTGSEKLIVTGQKRELQFLKWLVSACARKGVALYIFVSPVHADLLSLMLAGSGEEAYKDWVRSLVHTIHDTEVATGSIDKKVVAFWDFSGFNSITREPPPSSPNNKLMKWYLDCGHYSQKVGDLILNRMFDLPTEGSGVLKDFGMKLTPENVEKHLSSNYQDTLGLI